MILSISSVLLILEGGRQLVDADEGDGWIFVHARRFLGHLANGFAERVHAGIGVGPGKRKRPRIEGTWREEGCQLRPTDEERPRGNQQPDRQLHGINLVLQIMAGYQLQGVKATKVGRSESPAPRTISRAAYTSLRVWRLSRIRRT